MPDLLEMQRSHVCRMLLGYSGCEYQDDAWVPAKRDEWFAKKGSLGLDFPNLPYFIDGMPFIVINDYYDISFISKAT